MLSLWENLWKYEYLQMTVLYTKYVTLEHKTSHKCQFGEIEMYASSESWINNISIDVWFGQYL